MKKTGKNYHCKLCTKEFYVPMWRYLANRGKFCSRNCADEYKVGKPTSNSGQFKKGYKHTEEHKKLISEINKGKPTWNKGMKGYTNGGSFKSGPESQFWKGGITTENMKIRKSYEYKAWRKSVYQRDNYTCVLCGSTDRLEADHIKPFSAYPELRFETKNGRLLCHNCHIKTDSYGRGHHECSVNR